MNVSSVHDPAAAIMTAALANQQQLLTLAVQSQNLDAAKAAVLPLPESRMVDTYA